MAIAKGSRSHVLWKAESSYGVAPAGNWNSMPLNSETLDENINTVQGEDIRPDRMNPGLRGGNIATGGGIVTDFGPKRCLPWMAHLLASTPVTVNMTAAGATALAPSTPYALGDFVGGANNGRWRCVKAGSTGVGDDSTDLVGTTMVSLNSDAVRFEYLVADLMPSTSYSRGMLVKDSTGRHWICTRGGTTGAGVTDANLTGTTKVTITGATTSLEFDYVGASNLLLYRHTMRPSAAWPAAGLAIEKGIIGGDTNLFVQFLGCRVNSMELTVPQEGIVKATYNILAARSSKLLATGGGTPVTDSEAAFTGFNAFVGLNDPVGNTQRALRDFSLTLTNQATEDAYVLNDRFRIDIPEGIRRSSGRMSMYFLDPQEYDWFKNEVTIPLGLSFIWKGSMLKFDWPEVKLTGSGTPKISGAGIMQADFDWTAFVEDGTYDVEVTAINTLATLPS